MRNLIPQHNLFTGIDGTSDGTTEGYSESIFGDSSAYFVTLFAGNSDIAIEYREVQEHVDSLAPFAQLGAVTNHAEHISVVFRAGFEYRFIIVTAGTMRAAIHVTPLSSDSYEYRHLHLHENFTNDEDSWAEEFGWKNELPYVQEYGIANSLPPEWVFPANGTSLNGEHVPFDWSWGDCQGLSWVMDVGSTAGGNDIGMYSGVFGEHSVVARDLPTDGSPVHVTVHLACPDGTIETFTKQYTAANI